LLTSRDIRLKACRFESSFAISAGEDGEEPSSSSLSPDNGNCVAKGGGGDGALNRGRVKVGLLRSGDIDAL
jgi:hypothetical protein